VIVHEGEGDEFLRLFGERVRELRTSRGMTRKRLAQASGVSERYLAQLEAGQANCSILILRQLAGALSVPATTLVEGGERAVRDGRIALVGLRGAGKTTLGTLLAERLSVPFVELDREIEREAGVALATIFDFYGPQGYRRLERQCLERVLATQPRFVLATGGSLVTEPSTYALLRSSCYTVWLTASAGEHMERVIAQGDMRPMAGNRAAMGDLQRILASREALYRQADVEVSTSGRPVREVLESLLDAIPRNAG
jgi:XRE family aerobic/anaerobic benzoate catabolism transcriptional regulator